MSDFCECEALVGVHHRMEGCPERVVGTMPHTGARFEGPVLPADPLSKVIEDYVEVGAHALINRCQRQSNLNSSPTDAMLAEAKMLSFTVLKAVDQAAHIAAAAEKGELRELRARVARLTAALREIAEHSTDWTARTKARTTLQEGSVMGEGQDFDFGMRHPNAWGLRW
jgi:hypothetical protein